MNDLYRLVYASKNRTDTSEVEAQATITRILETSRRNNARVGVTGALLFNAGAFAQVLEGPRRAVEDTFERIQRDERHGEVTVLQCAPVANRGFADWSMGFVGRSARGQALWSDLASETGFDLTRMDGDAVVAMLHSLALDEEGVAAGRDPVPLARPAPALDVARVRAELPRPTSVAIPCAEADARAADPTPVRQVLDVPGEATSSVVTLVVLREALAAERQRTTDLRNTLDELQVALGHSRERAERLAGERDLWARRARLLAKALEHEATGADGGLPGAVGDERLSQAPPLEPGPRARVA